MPLVFPTCIYVARGCSYAVFVQYLHAVFLCMQFSFFVKIFRLSVVEYPTTKKMAKKKPAPVKVRADSYLFSFRFNSANDCAWAIMWKSSDAVIFNPSVVVYPTTLSPPAITAGGRGVTSLGRVWRILLR